MIIFLSILLSLVSGQVYAQVQPAKIRIVKQWTDRDVGAAQGVARIGEFIYVYGDKDTAQPRVGVIKEFTRKLEPTGRVIKLESEGVPLITHPTGLTYHPQWGAFLGDTVAKRGVIYQLDWDKALQQGHLTDAVTARIQDDAAINGTRPEFVEWQQKTYLSSADYGSERPELRLYDIEMLLEKKRSTLAVVRRVPFVPFTQTLAWDQRTGQLTSYRNVIAGLGWQIEAFNLKTLLQQGDTDARGARVYRRIFSRRDELEGALPVGRGYLFVTASSEMNMILGTITGTMD